MLLVVLKEIINYVDILRDNTVNVIRETSVLTVTLSVTFGATFSHIYSILKIHTWCMKVRPQPNGNGGKFHASSLLK